MLQHGKITVLLFLVSVLPGFSQDNGKKVSLPGYITELNRLAGIASQCSKNPQAIQEILRILPPSWVVKTGARNYTVSTEQLKAAISVSKNANSVQACKTFNDRIAVLKTDAQALQQPPLNFSQNRKILAEILARREFRDIHGPTMWDQWKMKVRAFILKLLAGILMSSAFANIKDSIIWIVMGVAAIVLFVWIFKILKRSVRLETIALQNSVPVSAKSWMIRMAEAQTAAAEERWRDAVHLAYWAGISFLESNGLWKPDRARTPREYLKLLSASHESWHPLAALTRKFEIIWYGYAEAGPESYFESLKHLESMGCRSN